jgi:DNA-directed RNA polymerase specialized sigma24 family protein
MSTQSQVEDRALMVKIAGGDGDVEAAMDKLYCKHRTKLLASARRQLDAEFADILGKSGWDTKHLVEPKDIVSETFLTAQEKANQYQPDKGDVLSWLFAIQQNLARDKARQIRSRRKRETLHALDHPPEGGFAIAPEEPEWEYGDKATAAGGICGVESKDKARQGSDLYRAKRRPRPDRIRRWMNRPETRVLELHAEVRSMFKCLGLVK